MVLKDEWMRAAMSDDELVAELLVRLKQSQAAAAASSSLLLRSPSPKMQAAGVLPLRWGLRLPRTRTASSASRCDAVSQHRNKEKQGDDSTRCSPTTPLSWSCGTASPSATADGFEESSRPSTFSSSATRSKGTAAYESTSTTTATKRARKKKTYAELKEEESSLLKERTHLKKEIATLQATFKEQRAKNVNLKRIKLDLNLHSATNLRAHIDRAEKAISSQPHERIATSDDLPHPHPQPDSYDEHKTGSSRDTSFVLPDLKVLPDLNMVPSEEESGSEMLYGMS